MTSGRIRRSEASTLTRPPGQPKSTHGGARPGAGRPKDPNAMVTCAFVIRQDQVEWVEERAEAMGISKSEVVRYALDEFSRPQR